MPITRRTFLASSLAAAATISRPARAAQSDRKKIALIGTGRLQALPRATLHRPLPARLRLAAAPGAARRRSRLALHRPVPRQATSPARRAKKHSVPIYPTIAEALTLGGRSSPSTASSSSASTATTRRNEKGQTLYPRYEFFKEVVKVFEASGRSVPVFNDKHLSTDWKQCAEMVADAKRLGFPFLAGSSLPVTRRHARRSTCRTARRSPRASASPTAAWTATTSTASKRPSACPSGATAARSGIRSVQALRGAEDVGARRQA